MATDYKHSTKSICLSAIVATILIALLMGCQTTGNRHLNRAVSGTNQFAIDASGTEQHVFTTRDMTISFQYQVEQGKLHVSGTSDIKYKDVDKLTMTLYYLDADGTVIDYYRFYSRPQKIKQGKVIDNTFDRTFEIPVDAKAISIGYIGHTRRGNKGTGWVFQHSPF